MANRTDLDAHSIHGTNPQVSSACSQLALLGMLFACSLLRALPEPASKLHKLENEKLLAILSCRTWWRRS